MKYEDKHGIQKLGSYYLNLNLGMHGFMKMLGTKMYFYKYSNKD